MRKLVTVLTLVVLFGCKKEKSVPAYLVLPGKQPVAVADTQAANNAPDLAAAPAAGVSAALREQQQPQQQQLPRMIVRTADVRIVVLDTNKAVDAITKAVEGAGGYISGSNIWREGELLRAKLTLRVPAAKLTSTLASIRALAKRVENETMTSEDVSQEYVDLESQLRNLEATEIELRELLKSVRQNTRRASDVLEVHQQLTAIRGDIERTKGRMRYLGQVTAMSSVSLEVIPDAIAAPVVEPGWQPVVVVKNAIRALIGALQNIVEIAIWILIYIVPIFGIIAIAVFGLWKGLRRLKAKEI